MAVTINQAVSFAPDAPQQPMPRPAPRTRLKIAIASAGRFHLLDLARELDALGQDVRLYSYVPRKQAASFGLPERCHVGLLPLVAPFVAWERLLPRVWPSQREILMTAAMDRAVIARLTHCDVFICLSGVFLEAARYAKRKFGAKVFFERGSRHIQSQREILHGIQGVRGPSDFTVHREMAAYAFADRIVIPATHVAESFERDPQAARKLFRNPYGVDLSKFPYSAAPKLRQKQVLFVGGWSYRKGADILAEVIMQMPDVDLHHVGDLGDIPFPRHPRFHHHPPVSQLDLARFYAQAHVFAIASREEGLAMVQVQALASGLQLVCTDRTGGEDLGHSAALAKRVRVVRSGDAGALKAGIEIALDKAMTPAALAPLSQEDRELLSWRAYGERYLDELLRLQ